MKLRTMETPYVRMYAPGSSPGSKIDLNRGKISDKRNLSIYDSYLLDVGRDFVLPPSSSHAMPRGTSGNRDDRGHPRNLLLLGCWVSS